MLAVSQPSTGRRGDQKGLKGHSQNIGSSQDMLCPYVRSTENEGQVKEVKACLCRYMCVASYYFC